MRILVANVNTTETMTEAIAEAARAVASPGTEIIGLTPDFGAESCEGNFESYLAAIAVMDKVLRYEGPYDAVIQAGYGEHGREGLQELLDGPGGRHHRCRRVHRHVPRAQVLGGHHARPRGAADRGPAHARGTRTTAAPLCARPGSACSNSSPTPSGPSRRSPPRRSGPSRSTRPRSSCSAAAAWPSSKDRVVELCGVPVVDGVQAAVAVAEGLVRLGLTTSKVRTYAPPRPKRITGFGPSAR